MVEKVSIQSEERKEATAIAARYIKSSEMFFWLFVLLAVIFFVIALRLYLVHWFGYFCFVVSHQLIYIAGRMRSDINARKTALKYMLISDKLLTILSKITNKEELTDEDFDTKDLD